MAASGRLDRQRVASAASGQPAPAAAAAFEEGSGAFLSLGRPLK